LALGDAGLTLLGPKTTPGLLASFVGVNFLLDRKRQSAFPHFDARDRLH
jgi:hypothetical protein